MSSGIPGNMSLCFKHTHQIEHTLNDGSGYKDGFRCTPPEGTTDLQAWAEAEVKRRRPGGHSWTVVITGPRT